MQPHNSVRRAAAKKSEVNVAPPNAGVKPPHGGVATARSVAQSTLLPPRCGVGLNDLLGVKEAGENETFADLPKLKRESPSAHPRTFSRM